jgi:hypothetical protein
MKKAFCLLMLLGVLPLFVPACTHYYVKPGATNSDFRRDKAACEKVGARESLKNGTRSCDETERCLEAKGWRRG